MIGPRSTTLVQGMAAFDQIPGILGDRWGHTIILANRDRVVCVSSNRVEYVGGDVCREVQVISRRSVATSPLEDRVAKVPGLPPRMVKLPDEETC